MESRLPRGKYLPVSSRVDTNLARISSQPVGRSTLGASGIPTARNTASSQPTNSLAKKMEVRDPRDLRSKAFQKSAIQDLVDFFSRTKYPHKLTIKAMQSPTARDIASMFEHLVAQIETNYRIPHGNLETEIMRKVTSFGYPFPLSKSQLTTPGAQHNFPSILGFLDWLRNAVDSEPSDAFVQEDEEIAERRLGVVTNAFFAKGEATVSGRPWNSVWEEHLKHYERELLQATGASSSEEAAQIETQASQLQSQVEAMDQLASEVNRERALLEQEKARLQDAQQATAAMRDQLALLHSQRETAHADSGRLAAEIQAVEKEVDECRKVSLRQDSSVREQLTEIRILSVVDLPGMRSALDSLAADNQEVELRLAKRITELHTDAQKLSSAVLRLRTSDGVSTRLTVHIRGVCEQGQTVSEELLEELGTVRDMELAGFITAGKIAAQADVQSLQLASDLVTLENEAIKVETELRNKTLKLEEDIAARQASQARVQQEKDTSNVQLAHLQSKVVTGKEGLVEARRLLGEAQVSAQQSREHLEEERRTSEAELAHLEGQKSALVALVRQHGPHLITTMRRNVERVREVSEMLRFHNSTELPRTQELLRKWQELQHEMEMELNKVKQPVRSV